MSLSIPISRLKDEDIEIMEKKLVIELEPKQKHGPKKVQGWKRVEKVQIVRREGEDKVMIPFHWGVSYFGKDFRRPREMCGRLVSSFNGTLRPEQKCIFQESVHLLNQTGSCLMAIYPGGGKCLGRGTELRMADGTIKKVENVVVGDRLLGEDGFPRNVRSTCCGYEEMYWIRDANHQVPPFRCNRSHILTVWDSVQGCLCDIGLMDLLLLNGHDRRRYRGVYFDLDIPVIHPLKEKREQLRKALQNYPFRIVPSGWVPSLMLCGLSWQGAAPGWVQVNDPHCVLEYPGKRVFGTYRLEVVPDKIDEYFGFEIDGNRRFLLANGICTHNTITSLSIASAIHTRTMIFVNKLVLIDQWLDTIYRWFGPSTPVQVIQGKSRTLQPGKDFYIVNAINVPKHLFDDYSNLGIGLLIVDECHLMMTKIFSQALSYICPRYLMGLSATPYRMDGFDVLLELYFGLHKVIRKLHRPHTVYCLDTKIKIEHDRDARGEINWNSVIDKQTSHKERNKKIAELCCIHSSRNILILSKRIKQIEEIGALLREKGEDVTMMKENENSFNREARILIATFQKVGTGFSHDKLDMLLLASDTEEYFIQYLGRVFRRPDVEPVIIDLVDKHPILKRHFQSRKTIYEQSGGLIKYIEK